MGTDFFDDLSETITRTAREFGERAESIYETQKLRGKISGEERKISSLMTDLGKMIYKSYTKGGELPEAQKVLCERIDQHMEAIERFKSEMADKKGRKICPSCGEAVEKSVSFCPHCGAACPTPEPEEASGDVVDEAEAAVEDADEHNCAETEAPGFQEEPAEEGTQEDAVESEPEDESAGE